jgi:hypothetical protein
MGYFFVCLCSEIWAAGSRQDKGAVLGSAKALIKAVRKRHKQSGGRRLESPAMTITKLFRLLAWVLVAAAVVITLSPLELRPSTGASPRLERFVAFAVIAGVFCLGYPQYRIHIIVLIIGLVLMLEIGQKFVPGRHGRLLRDGLPKVSGAFCGFALAVFIERCAARFRTVP